EDAIFTSRRPSPAKINARSRVISVVGLGRLGPVAASATVTGTISPASTVAGALSAKALLRTCVSSCTGARGKAGCSDLSANGPGVEAGVLPHGHRAYIAPPTITTDAAIAAARQGNAGARC